MNTILIVDASASDSRIMSGLLTRAGYNPVFVDGIDRVISSLRKQVVHDPAVGCGRINNQNIIHKNFDIG